MTQIFKTFPGFGIGLAEQRLIHRDPADYFDTPDHGDFGRVEVRQQERIKFLHEVNNRLSLGAVGNKDFEKMLEDPWKRQLIVALVGQQGDGTKQWITPEMRKILRKWHPDHLSSDKEVKEIKNAVTGKIRGYLDDLQEVLTDLKEARDDYPDDKAIDDAAPHIKPTEKGLLDNVEFEEAFNLIRTLREEHKKFLSSHVQDIIDVQNGVFAAKDEVELKEISDGAHPTIILNADQKRAAQAAFRASAGKSLDARKQAVAESLMKTLDPLVGGLVVKLKDLYKKVRAIKAKLDKKLERKQRDIDDFITKRFPQRPEWLRAINLKEATPDEAIALSLDDKGIIDAKRMYITLVRLGYPKADQVKIKQILDQAKADLIALRPGVFDEAAIKAADTAKDAAGNDVYPGIDEAIFKALVVALFDPRRGRAAVLGDPKVVALRLDPNGQEEFISLLYSFWRPTAVRDYLKDLGLRDNPNKSFRNVLFKALLNTELAKTLERKGLRDVAIRDIVSLAKVDAFDKLDHTKDHDLSVVPPGTRQKISTILLDPSRNLFIDKQGINQLSVNKERIVSLLTFFFIEKPNPEQAANQYWEALQNHRFDHDRNAATPEVSLFSKTNPFLLRGDKAKAELQALLEGAKNPKDKDGNAIPVEKLVFTKQIQEHLVAMRKADLHKLGFFDKAKWTLNEIGSNIASGTSKWWSYMKSLPRLFYDSGGDDTLLTLLNQRSAMDDFSDGLEDMLDTEALHEGYMKAAATKLQEHYQALNLLTDDPRTARGVREDRRQAQLLLAAAKIAFDGLDTVTDWDMPKNSDPKLRAKVFYIAVNYDIDAAKEFLRSGTLPLVGGLNAAGAREAVKAAEAFAGRVFDSEEILTKDVRVRLRNRYKVRLAPNPWGRLQSMLGPDGQPIAIHIDDWMHDPAAAKLGLGAILYDEAGHVGGAKALIEAFTTDLDGAPNPAVPGQFIEKAEAQKVVAELQKLLISQSDKMDIIEEGAETDGSFEILDVFNIGFDTLSELRNSGDIGTKLFGYGLTIGIPVALFKVMMNKNSKWRPRLFALAIAVGINKGWEVAKGKTLLEELNLAYRSKEERNKPQVRFMDEMKEREKYKFLGENAGEEAVRGLTDPRNNISIASLLQWRQNVFRGRGITFEGLSGAQQLAMWEENTPYNIKKVVGNVEGALGTIDASKKGSNAMRNKAYRYVLYAFEAFCVRIAEQNKLGEPKVQNGMRYLDQSYVQLLPPGYVPGSNPTFDAAMAEYRRLNKGTITMAEVMALEDREGALYKKRRSISEIVGDGIGDGVDWVGDMIERGYTEAQILAMTGAEKIPEYFDITKEFVINTAGNIGDWLRVTYAKVAPEVKQDVVAAWNLVAGLATEAGLLIINKGPKLVEWAIDTTGDVASFTLDSARNIYRELRKIQGIGNLMDGFEAVMKAVFGTTLAELVIYESDLRKLSEKDVRYTDEYLDKLAEEDRTIDSLVNNLATIVTPPNKDQVRLQWLPKAQEAVLGPGKAPTNSNERMAVYEYMKRQAYSHVIARRINEIDAHRNDKDFVLSYPLDITWRDDLTPLPGSLEEAIFKTYGVGTIALFGSEKTGFAGAILEKSQDPTSHLVPKTFYKVLNLITDAALRQNAKEYLDGVNEYLHPFELQAEKAFGVGTKKYTLYMSYLQTLVTNVTLEITMGAFEGYRKAGKGVSGLRFDPNSPLGLTIKQAKEILDGLRYLRGDAPNLDDLKDGVNFEAFESIGGAPPALGNILKDKDLMAKIGSIRPGRSTGASPPGGGPSGAPPRRAPTGYERFLTKRPPLNFPTQLVLFQALEAPGVSAAQNTKIRKLFLDNLNHPKGLPDPFDFKNKDHIAMYAMHYGVLDITATPAIEDKLYKKLQELVNIGKNKPPDTTAVVELAANVRQISASPKAREQVQRLINRLITEMVDKISKKMVSTIGANSKISKLPTSGAQFERWRQQLTDLYAASFVTGNEKISDYVAVPLELLLLQRGAFFADDSFDTFNNYLKGQSANYKTKKLNVDLVATTTGPYNYKGFPRAIDSFKRCENFREQFLSIAPIKPDGHKLKDYFAAFLDKRIAGLRAELF